MLWTGAYYGTELLQLFPDHTVANQIAVPVGFALGFVVRQALGLRKQYQKAPESLPKGVEEFMDKKPDKWTGIKGCKK